MFDSHYPVALSPPCSFTGINSLATESRTASLSFQFSMNLALITAKFRALLTVTRSSVLGKGFFILTLIGLLKSILGY